MKMRIEPASHFWTLAIPELRNHVYSQVSALLRNRTTTVSQRIERITNSISNVIVCSAASPSGLKILVSNPCEKVFDSVIVCGIVTVGLRSRSKSV